MRILFIVLFQLIQQSFQQQETHEFQAETSRMMDIIINSLYTDKEVFLRYYYKIIRELVSNAADALDKIRFQSLSDETCLKANSELSIKVSFSASERTITVQDSGIGMTKNDMIQNLGTLAKSGTTSFIEQLKAGNMNLIGQFGVGFYSAFLVANKVQVYSKHNDDKQYLWESSQASSFTIEEDSSEDIIRGTKVVLHLKQDALEFAVETTIKSLLQKYSEFVVFPIYLNVQKFVQKEVVDDTPQTEKVTVESSDPEEQKLIDEENSKPKMKNITETIYEWEQTNLQKPIWLRDKSEVDESEYVKFYKEVFKDHSGYLTHSHFRGEGEVEFKAVLFVPKYYNENQLYKYDNKQADIKLYIRRIMIQEKIENILPRYLTFIKGIIDSDDLPLNVNREGLQQLKLMKIISKKVTKKALDMVLEMTKDDPHYNKFWKEYGKTMKLGLYEDKVNKDKLAKLVRFYTSNNITLYSSFDKYIGEALSEMIKSPVIQSLIDGKFEVILLTETLDEFAFNDIQTYEGYSLINVSKGEFKLPSKKTSKKYEKKLREMYNPLTEFWQQKKFKLFTSVVISERLTKDPCLVVGVEGGSSANQERIQRSQAHADQRFRSKAKMVLEINPSHPIIKKLLELTKDGYDKPKLAQAEKIVTYLTDTSLVVSGFALEDITKFSDRFFDLIKTSSGIDESEVNEDIQFEEFDEEKEIEQEEKEFEEYYEEYKAENPVVDDQDEKKKEKLTTEDIEKIIDDL